MTPRQPDRDAAIEQLITGTLRHAAAEPSSTRCLDANALASWADGTLDANARGALEAHAATCARCQATLAALVRTMPPAVRIRWWQRPLVRIALPAAAAASLALLVWTVRPLPLDRSAAAPPAAAGMRAVAPPAAAASGPPDLLAHQELQQERNAPAPAPPRADQSRAARAKDAATESLDTLGRKEAFAPPARQVAANALKSSESSADKKAGEPAEQKVREEAAKPLAAEATAPTAAAAPPPAAPSAALQEKITLGQARGLVAKRAAAAAPDVPSPDPRVRWRISGTTQASIVERTTDAGATWQRQDVGADLVAAGAAPSPSVCWLVGPGGTVRVTLDGASWQRVAFPEATDLTGVTASDGRHASVTTAGGVVLTTADGGRTWSRAR